jgi:WD40 repeat protein
VDNDIIVYMVANSVVLWNLNQNTKSFIWHNSLGITTCAANPRNNLIAVGEEGNDPRVCVYSYPQKTLVRSLDGGAAVMYSALAFSRTGSRLVTVGDYPKYTLRVWENEKLLISLDLEKEPVKLLVHDSILLLFKHEIRLITIFQSFQVIPLNVEDVVEDNRYSVKTFNLAETEPLDAVFDKFGNIYLSTKAGELLVVRDDLRETKVIQRYEFRIVSMVLTHRFLVIANSDNKLQWLNIYIPPEENDPRNGKNLNLRVQKELTLDDKQDIIQLMFVSGLTKLLMIGGQGKIQLLHIPADPPFNPDEEEENKASDDEGADDDEEDESFRKPKIIATTPQILGQYHIGSIKQVTGLGDSTQCASIGEDLRVWEIVTGENIMQYSSPGETEFCSIDSNIPGNLLVVGSVQGCVRFFDVSNRMICRLVNIVRLGSWPVDRISISPDQRLVVCASSQSKELFFLEGSFASKFRVVGFVELPAKALAVSWRLRQVVVLLHSSMLVAFDAPKVDLPSSIDPISVKFQFRYIAEGSGICVLGNKVYVAGCSKDVHVYNMPDLEMNDIDLRKLPPEPVEYLEVAKLQTSVVALSPNNQFIAVGCIDGTIKIVGLQNKGSVLKQIHGSSGVQNLSFSADSSLLFSTGHERDFFSWSMVGKLIDRPILSSQAEDSALEALEVVEDLSDNDVKLVRDILAESKAKSEAKDVERVKSKQRARAQEIQDKLYAMLKANEKAPDLEKLDRDEFILDLKAKKKIEDLGKERAKQLKEEAKKKNLAQELLQKRVKEKTLDRMEVNSRVICSFLTDQIVYNYTIRKLDDFEKQRFEKIRAFRSVELREQKTRKEAGVGEIIAYEDFAVDWIIGKQPEDWRNHPLLISLDKKRDSQIKDGKKKPMPEWELIYPAPLIYTPSRKRTQIFLLSMICRAFKEGFNTEFEKLEAFKEKQIDLIEEKNTLIVEKQKELNSGINVFKHRVHPLEDPMEVLKVKDSDFTVEKYLSREERDALEEKQRKEEERIRLLNADDSKKKALIQMMNGTIENKKSSLSIFAEKLAREEWMDKPVSDMTDDQRQKLKEFEEKEKKHNEEKEKLRKILEGELKKLQGEVNELCKAFDLKVKDLFLMRLDTDYEIYQMELMMARLSLSILSDQKRKEEVNVLRDKKDQLEDYVKDLEDQSRDLQNHIDHIQNKIKNLHDDLKALDNRFKGHLESQAIAQADQNKLKSLLKSGPENKDKSGKNPEVEKILKNLNENDPYTPLEREKILAAQAPPQNRELTAEDLPQSITDQALILRVINDRKKKIELERPIPGLTKHIKEVEVHKSWIQKKKAKAESKLKDLITELRTKEQESIKQKYNTELLLKMKQAIVEVPQQPVVTDYSDAILIHKQVVIEKNDDIKTNGRQKISILHSIADIKGKVAKVKWREELLKLETEDYRASEGDLKMLRIDKRLQNILAGRGLDENQQMAERILSQISHLNENTVKRVKQIQEKEQALMKTINDLTRDNEILENEVYEMEIQEKQREDLIKLKTNLGEKKTEKGKMTTQEMKTKMKSIKNQAQDNPGDKFLQIALRREMMDMIEQYREEIEFLNDELDRLRAKTFPSFAHLQAHVDFPDEY